VIDTVPVPRFAITVKITSDSFTEYLASKVKVVAAVSKTIRIR